MAINAFDYGAFMDVLINGIKAGVGCDVIIADDTGTPPAFPYVTAQFLQPRLDIMAPVIGRPTQFDIVVSLTVHSSDLYETLTVVGQLQAWFRDHETRFALSQQAIYLVDVYDYEQRDNAYSIGYDRRGGFDVRLRVPDVLNDNTPAIETIGLTNATNETKFTTTKQSEGD
ncbi:phage neck terminator protein [Furfurilactobacillus sp. WILCCON 0119]